MKKMNSSTKQLILLIFNSVLTIATFVITYYIDPLKYTSQSSLAAVPAFLLSIIVLIIGQNITTHNEVQKVSEDSELICETVKNYLHVTKMGTPKYAWEYIINRLPVLDYVQNTRLISKMKRFKRMNAYMMVLLINNHLLKLPKM